MTAERIKEIQQQTAYPDSISVQQALLQVWNECSKVSQPEISDEEALRLAKEINKQPMIFVPYEISDEDIKRGIKREYLFSNSEEKRLMIEGAIWYKEQLKQNK